jgi:hypothetical protein
MVLTVEPSGAMTFKKSSDNVTSFEGNDLDQWLAKQHAH